MTDTEAESENMDEREWQEIRDLPDAFSRKEPLSTEKEEETQEDLRERFTHLTDEEVVEMSHQGEPLAEDYLLDKYKNFVRAKARSYFLIGADHEDIKTATRQKHIPLNSYISLNKPLYDEESDRTLMDVIMEGKVSNPEEIIINREDLTNINEKIKEVLSGLEQEVLSAYLDGKSYQEIAESLGRHVKSIDNALQRVKRKLEKYLEETAI